MDGKAGRPSDRSAASLKALPWGGVWGYPEASLRSAARFDRSIATLTHWKWLFQYVLPKRLSLPFWETNSHIGNNLPDFLSAQPLPKRWHRRAKLYTAFRDRPEQILVN